MATRSVSSDTTDAEVVRTQASHVQLSLSPRSQRWRKWLLALVAMLVLSQVLIALPNPPSRPILFVHGYCGSPYDWAPLYASLVKTLPSYMYPDRTVYLVQYNRNTDDYSIYKENDPINNPSDLTLVTDPEIIVETPYARFFVIQFYDPDATSGNTDPQNVAKISILNKAYEIKRTIDKIIKLTGVPSVNIVAHSMGGLDARAYAENLASREACYSGNFPYYSGGCAPGVKGTEYANDVANIITIDTPHRGTPLATPSGLGQLLSSLDPDLKCSAYESTNMAELLPRANFGAGLIEILNYDISIFDTIPPPSVNTVPIQAVQDYFTAPTESWLPNPLLPSGLPGESDDIVQKVSQSISSNLPFWNSYAPTIGSIPFPIDIPVGYDRNDVDTSGVGSISDCWVTPDSSLPILHNLKCLAALPSTQGAISSQLIADDMLWINSWSVTPLARNVGDSVTIGYSALDRGTTKLSIVRLWRAPSNENGLPGAWTQIGPDDFSVSGKTVAEGTFEDKPPEAPVSDYWYVVDMVDSKYNNARAPIWFKATFTPASTSYALTVSTAGSGTVTSSDGYIDCGSSCTHIYSSGTSATLSAAPASGWNFSKWSGDCSGSGSCTVTMNAAQAVTANYTNLAATAYTLTVNSTNPASGVGITADSMDNNGATGGTTPFALTYEQGTQVALTAPPTAGGKNFSTWTGCDVVLDSRCVVTVNANSLVTANYSTPGPVDFGMVSIGQTSAALPLTITFSNGGALGSVAALTQGSAGLDFAVANPGTCTAGTYYSAGNSCTMNVTFTPKFAGIRNGAVVLRDGGGNVIAMGYVHGTGWGPQASFQPGSQITLHSGFGSPNGVAVDGSGNVFVADAGNAVYEVPTAGGYNTVQPLGGGFSGPTGVALDASGNVFVADSGNHAVKEIPPGCISASCVKTLGGSFGFYRPYGVAVDGSGNVFVSDAGNNAVYEIPAAGGYTTVNALASGLITNPTSIAVDGSGNVFVVSGWSVYEIPAAGGYATVNALANSPYYYPTGVAVDGNGNVFYSSYYYGAWWPSSQVSEIPSGCVAANCIKSLSGVGGYLYGLAVDGSGNVFASDSYNQHLVKLDFGTSSLTFGTPTAVGSVDTADGPQTVTMQNIGNAPLTFQPFFTSNLLDAVLPSLHTTDCTELSGLQLGAGASCTLPIEFAPSQSGLVNGHVHVVDNALNVAFATQTIAVQGTGIGSGPEAQTINFLSPGTQDYGVSPITLMAAATSGLTVSYSVTSGPATVSGNTLTITGAGTVVVQASQTGDGVNWAAATPVSINIAVNQANATVILSNLSQTYIGAPEPVGVSTSPSGLTVTFTYTGIDGTSYPASATPPTNPGSYQVVATVVDSNYIGGDTETLTINQLDPALNFKLMGGMPTTTPYGTTVYFDLAMASTPLCPTGSVQLYVDGSAFDTPVTLSGASCTQPVQFQTATMTAGTHNLYAVYIGDTYYQGGTSGSVSYTVTQNTTSVTLAASSMSVNVGQSVTFTATVTPSAFDPSAQPPAGTVQFFDGANQIGTVALSAASPYTAAYTTSSLAAGSHSISATFVASDGNFAGSSSPVDVETVNLIVPTIHWTPSPTEFTYGTPLVGSTQLNATAVDPNTGNPISGSFAYNFAAGAVLPAGTVNLTATFTPADSATYAGNSATVTLTVDPAVLTVTASNASIVYGQSLPSFSYTITGFVNGDNGSAVSGTATETTTATSTSLPGTYPITFSTESLSAANYTFSYVNGTLTITGSPAPTLTSIAPNTGARGTRVPITLSGTNLTGTSSITVSGTGVTVSSLTAVNSTTVTATFTIASTATLSARTVSVTTLGGTSNTATFTVVNPPAPTLTSIAPNTGIRGTSVPVTLTGTNLSGASSITVSGTGVTVSNLTVVNSTTVTATFTIATSAKQSARTVSVTSLGGTSNNVTFTVATPPAPTLTSIAPNSGIRGTSVAVTLTGTNLTGASAVTVSGTGVTVSGLTVVNSTSVTAIFTITTGATLSARTVSITTLGGTSNTVMFTVQGATLTSITPNTGIRGTSLPVTLTGTNLTGATSVTVSGTGVTVSNLIVVNSTTVTATFTITTGATLSARTVSVTTPIGTTNTMTYTVQGPTLTLIAPNTGLHGTSVPVTLTGTNLTGASAVTVSGTGVTVSGLTVVNSTSVTATFTITAGAKLSARTVSVTTPIGTSNTVTFTVN